MLITFEGIDGSGKTTQAELLTDALQREGWCTKLIDNNSGRPMRQLSRGLISSMESFPPPLASLFLGLSDLSYTIDRLFESFKKENHIIIFDRYIYSAITDATALGLSELPIDHLLALFPPPDITVYFAMNPKIALSRKSSISLAEAGGPEFVKRNITLVDAFLDFQERVFHAYELLIDRMLIQGNIVQIDSMGNKEEIHQFIKGKAIEMLQQVFVK
jgi:dTMP kinase